MNEQIIVSALGEEFQRLSLSLSRYALSKINDIHLAEDLVQDAFEKALVYQAKQERKNQDIKDLQAWLISVLRNSIVDHYRRQANTMDRLVLDYEDIIDELDTHQDLEVHALMAQHLSPFFERLDTKYRDILIAKEVHRMSIKQLSQEFDLAESTVKSRLFRGRKILKQMLVECCHFDIKDGIVDDLQPRCWKNDSN